MALCSLPDVAVVEKAISRHWFDIRDRVYYTSGGVFSDANAIANNEIYTSFSEGSTYHLIYAYLIENTRIIQIFEKMLDLYMQDETLGIADDDESFRWIINTEQLFYKIDLPRATNIRSLIRPSNDASRRNAYWRMFGMDLAFGDSTSGPAQLSYHKAITSNQQFIVLFEKFLTEIWQGYINASNTSGPNTTDTNIIVDLATEIQEMLIARRGLSARSTTVYHDQNLSREEFSSVLICSWLTFVISYDSPMVQFLNCQSSSIGERLLKIGAKVGIKAHSKCQTLFEMAGAASSVLTTIELGGVFDDEVSAQELLRSLLSSGSSDFEIVALMTDLLTLINNWEKATGHRIKNPESNIRGVVSISSRSTNGRQQTAKV